MPLDLMATGYTGQDPFEKAQAMHPSFPHAAGTLVANVKDLALWAYALHHDGILSQPSYLEMIAPTRLNDGTVQDYGFGLFIGADADGRPTIGHSGGIYGFSTDSIYYPDEDVFIAILVNSDEPSSDPSLVMLGLSELLFGAE